MFPEILLQFRRNISNNICKTYIFNHLSEKAKPSCVNNKNNSPVSYQNEEND